VPKNVFFIHGAIVGFELGGKVHVLNPSTWL
jgi:hypothetical protein